MPKVLYEVNGRPMIDYVVDLALRLDSERTIVIVGHHRDAVVEHVRAHFGDRITFVEQLQQLGTGHAVLQTEKELEGFEGDILVLSGDVPFLAEPTVRLLLTIHAGSGSVATILTADVPNPTGYGRIVRNETDRVMKIVEQRDATEQEKLIKEINSGVYVFKKMELFAALKTLRRDNAQQEYYLTGVFERFWEKGLSVSAVKAKSFDEVRGINTFDELREARQIFSGGPLRGGRT